MRYLAAAVLVMSLYFLGRARGAFLKAKARRTILLAQSIARIADYLKLMGMPLMKALNRLAAEERFLPLEFYREAWERVLNGEEVSKALPESLGSAASQFSAGAADAAASYFSSIGRSNTDEEADSAERAAAKLQKLGEEAFAEGVKMQRFYGSVYAIAGAAAAVLLM